MFITDIFSGYRWQFLLWSVTILAYVFLFFDSATIASLNTLLEVFLFKLIVSLLASVYLLAFLTFIHICPLMPLVAPHAMCQLFVKNGLIEFGQAALRLIGIIWCEAVKAVITSVTRTRIHIEERLIKTSQFPLSSLPYRLYPQSCILLE